MFLPIFPLWTHFSLCADKTAILWVHSFYTFTCGSCPHPSFLTLFSPLDWLSYITGFSKKFVPIYHTTWHLITDEWWLSEDLRCHVLMYFCISGMECELGSKAHDGTIWRMQHHLQLPFCWLQGHSWIHWWLHFSLHEIKGSESDLEWRIVS